LYPSALYLTVPLFFFTCRLWNLEWSPAHVSILNGIYLRVEGLLLSKTLTSHKYATYLNFLDASQLLYYLFDRHWTRPDSEWRYLVDDFAATFGITNRTLLECLEFCLLDDHSSEALEVISCCFCWTWNLILTCILQSSGGCCCICSQLFKFI
jgi:hypothetical protein